MTQIRPTVKKSEWKISKHAFYMAQHYAYQYSEWKDRYDSIQGLNAVVADGMPHANTVGSPTERQAIELAELSQKMELIEATVREADEEIYPWLLKAVSQEGITYNYLSMVMRIPCGHNRFYYSRRKFYYLLSRKIG